MPKLDRIMGFFKKIGKQLWALKGKEFGLDDRTYYAVRGRCGHCCLDIQVDITTAIEDFKSMETTEWG